MFGRDFDNLAFVSIKIRLLYSCNCDIEDFQKTAFHKCHFIKRRHHSFRLSFVYNPQIRPIPDANIWSINQNQQNGASFLAVHIIMVNTRCEIKQRANIIYQIQPRGCVQTTWTKEGEGGCSDDHNT